MTASSKPITHEKIAEEGIIKDHLQKEFQDLVAYLPTVEAGVLALAQKLSTSLKGIKIEGLDVAGLQKLNEQMKVANDLEKVSSDIKKVKVTLSEKEQAQAQIDKANAKDRISSLKAEIIEMDKTVGTLQRVEAANAKLRIERKSLNTETAEGKKRLVELNAEIDKNNNYIKENSDQLKRQKMNVGNYTESIKKAFEGTGELGEAMNKYLGIITLLSEKIEGITEFMHKSTEAENAKTTATEAGTVAEESKKDVIIESTLATEAAGTVTIELAEAEKGAAIATKEASVAEKANIVSLEAETAATEAATAATEGLGASLKALATNPFVLAAVAIAALAKIVYDNVTATQAQKDAWEAGEEGAKAFARAALVAGVNATQYASDIRKLTLAEFEKQDLEIKALTLKKAIAEEAAEARNQAAEENRTTIERIQLLQKFIDKTKEGGQVVAEELAKEVQIKRDFVEKAQGLETREQRRALQEALAAENQNKIDVFNATRKAQLQITTLTEKYRDELRKINQAAQKDELDAIDTYSNLKASKEEKQKDHNIKELSKNLKLLQLESKQKIDNLEDEQRKMGVIDAQGIDHTNEFEKAKLDIKKLYAEKEKELKRKVADDNAEIDFEIQVKAYKEKKSIQDEEIKYEIEALTGKYGEAEELIAKQEVRDKIALLTATPEEQNAFYATFKDTRKNFDDEFTRYELDAIHGKYGKIEKIINKKRLRDKMAAGLPLTDEEKAELESERKKQIDEAEKAVNEITKGIEEGLRKRAEMQQAYDQKDIDQHQRAVDVQLALAAAGKKNVLAEELASTAKAEEKKIQDEKKAAKRQEALALIDTFSRTLSAALKSGKPFIEAFGEALASEGVVSATFSKLFSGYKDGVENLQGAGTGTSDSNIALLSKGESVATADATAENPGLVTAMNKGMVDEYVEKMYLPQYNSANSSPSIGNGIQHDHVLAQIIDRKFDSLQRTIERKPVQQTHLGRIGEWTEKVMTDTMNFTVNHKKTAMRPSLRLRG